MRAVLAILAAGVLAGAAQAAPAFPDLTGLLRDCGDPAASPDICRLRADVPPETVAGWLGDARIAAHRDGDRLDIVARGSGDALSVAGALNAPMARLPQSDLWLLTIRSRRLDEAMLDLFLSPPPEAQLRMFEWLGPRAPAQPPAPTPGQRPAGRFLDATVQSAALGGERKLSVYLPPGHDPRLRYPVAYMADGQAVAFYARLLEPAIAAGRLPPLVIVGLHNGGNEQRSRDYLIGRNGSNAAFEAFEAFLTGEVMPRAEREWGASSEPRQRLLIGKSSGGAWAVATAVRNPKLFGQAAGFAVGWGPAGGGVERSGRPRLRLVTGVFDDFIGRTREIAAKARGSGDELVLIEPASGHGDLFYRAELEPTLAWAFGPASGTRP